MKKVKRIGALLLGVLMLAGCVSMTAQAEEGYTYNYDYWGDVQYSPDAYSFTIWGRVAVTRFPAKDITAP